MGNYSLKKSKIIVVEGPDRVGKATQSEILKQFLIDRGFKVQKIEVPIQTNFAYTVVYLMLKTGLASSLPRLFQWMQYLNRQIFQWYELPALDEACDYVIFDRWYLSSEVYGEATGVPPEFTNKLCRRLRNPDFTIILLGPSHQHEAEDVYEANTDLQTKVRHLYAKWAQEHPGMSVVLDCTLPREVIASEVQSALAELDII